MMVANGTLSWTAIATEATSPLRLKPVYMSA